MNIYALPITALVVLYPSVAPAQVHVGISIGLPVAPQMEIIAPGIQVVTGFQEEVFLQGGWYWCRRPDGWYRSRNGRANFDYVDSGRVPRGLVRMPEGRYRNWQRPGRNENHGPAHYENRGPARNENHGPARNESHGPAHNESRGPGRGAPEGHKEAPGHRNEGEHKGEGEHGHH